MQRLLINQTMSPLSQWTPDANSGALASIKGAAPVTSENYGVLTKNLLGYR